MKPVNYTFRPTPSLASASPEPASFPKWPALGPALPPSHASHGGGTDRAGVERKGFVKLSFTAWGGASGGLKPSKGAWRVIFDLFEGRKWVSNGKIWAIST